MIFLVVGSDLLELVISCEPSPVSIVVVKPDKDDAGVPGLVAALAAAAAAAKTLDAEAARAADGDEHADGEDGPDDHHVVVARAGVAANIKTKEIILGRKKE